MVGQVCEAPNGVLHQWHGTVTLEGQEPMVVTEKQLLLRGAKLRNTKAAWGIAVYTGHETKVLKNNEPTKSGAALAAKENNSLPLPRRPRHAILFRKFAERRNF